MMSIVSINDNQCCNCFSKFNCTTITQFVRVIYSFVKHQTFNLNLNLKFVFIVSSVCNSKFNFNFNLIKQIMKIKNQNLTNVIDDINKKKIQFAFLFFFFLIF